MKICIATHHFPPQFMGGVELITMRLAQDLIQRGFQVEVITVESIDAPKITPVRCMTEIYEGITIHRLDLNLINAPNAFLLGYRNPYLAEWFTQYLRNSHPDLVHIHSGYLLSASMIEASIANKVACIVTLHDYWYFCPRINLIHPNGNRCSGPEQAKCVWCLKTEQRRYLLPDKLTGGLFGKVVRRLLHQDRLMQQIGWSNEVDAINARQDYVLGQLRQATAILTPALLVRDMLVQLGFESNAVRILKHGLNLNNWQGLGKTSSERIRVGYLGNLYHHKGVHILIRAFRQVQAASRKLELHVYGDINQNPAYTEKLVRLAGRDNRIFFGGRYENSNVEEILSNIDILVVPSVCYEIGPLVTLEAFASHTPVIASNIPNMCYQIKNGVDGLLFDPGNVSDLTHCLWRLTDEPDLLSILTKGVTSVRQFSTEVDELVAVYSEFAS